MNITSIGILGAMLTIPALVIVGMTEKKDVGEITQPAFSNEAINVGTNLIGRADEETIPRDPAIIAVEKQPLQNSTKVEEKKAADTANAVSTTSSQSGFDFNAQQIEPEMLQRLREEKRRELARKLDAQLTAELKDSNWRVEIENKVQTATALLPQLSDVALTSVQCAQTLCRLTLSAPNRPVFDTLRNLNVGIGLVLASDAWVRSDVENLTTDVYLSRPGQTLPK